MSPELGGKVIGGAVALLKVLERVCDTLTLVDTVNDFETVLESVLERVMLRG